jgi:hypothetical protein
MDDSEEVCLFIDITINSVDNPTIWIMYVFDKWWYVIKSSVSLVSKFYFVHQ